jgi:hypothetical protein
MPGQSDIIKNLSQQAVSESALGGKLSPEEERSAVQAARAGYAARGTALGQQSNLAEVLNRYNMQQQRQAQRAQFAAGTLNLQQQAIAPALQAYYQQPILQNAVGQAQAAGMQYGQSAGPALFNPESQMGFQSAWVPYQAQMAQNLGQMQAEAGMKAAKMQMIGQMASSFGAAAGAAASKGCWVAREVYGEQNATWKMFRSWMFFDAPDWLCNLYMKHGEKIANFIKNKPFLKKIIRVWMDSKIKQVIA